MRAHLLLLLAAVSFNLPAHAQKKTVVDANRPMSISYGSKAWNRDSAKIDSAYLVLRDKATNKLVQIQLEETEPDSSEFNGRFSVNLGANAEKVEPEIYVPPDSLRGGEKDYRKLYEMISKGQLERKPVIWKKNERGQALIDVYDTRDQATQALKAYQDQQKIAQEMKKNQLIKPVPSEQNLAAAQQLERKKLLDNMALEAAKRESDRVRLEQIEKQKAEEKERQAKALSEKERAERRAKAKAMADEGMELFNKGDFAAAEDKFKQATDLDPENTEHYFKYGVTLYRNDKFNDALVILKLAKVEAARENEKAYFMGLSHYRLKELDPASGLLEKVAASKDPQMAPSSLFYLGMIQFAQEKYDAAKKSFETVIDTSGDPRLDEQAEAYLDRISTAMMYKKLRENKWTLTGTIGAMYDSNVLLAPDNAADQGLPTNISDFRLMTIAQIDYRPIFSEHHEFTPGVNASLTNSSKDSASAADAWIYDFYVPYSYKGLLWGKGYKLTVKPMYETLYMSLGESSKKSIMNSPLVSIDNTFVMNPNFFSIYTLEVRQDDSTTSDSIGDNDADATKITVKTTQMAILDKSKKEVVMGTLGYVMNSAKGKEKLYNRVDLGATYVRPVFWSSSWLASLNAYQLNYPKASESRTDLNVTLTTGLTKPIREWVTWGLIGSYTKNNSNDSTQQYTKYTVLTTATFTTNF